MTTSVITRTISRHYNAPPLNYIQAPSMIISRINSTNTIAALEPVPHPQLPIYIPPFFLFIIFYGKIKKVCCTLETIKKEIKKLW